MIQVCMNLKGLLKIDAAKYHDMNTFTGTCLMSNLG